MVINFADAPNIDILWGRGEINVLYLNEERLQSFGMQINLLLRVHNSQKASCS